MASRAASGLVWRMMERKTSSECANCGIAFSWPPVWSGESPFCCYGCAQGGPCVCTYTNPKEFFKMKMILAIVQDEDVPNLLEAAAQRGLRATKVSSTGGFLRSGNSTLLMGVEDAQVTGVLDLIRTTCRTRKQSSSAIPTPREGVENAVTPYPIEVEVGGANVFVWDVEQYIRV